MIINGLLIVISELLMAISGLWGSQGCASWPRNPDRPPKQPFWHQSGRHMVIFHISEAILRRISLRISPGGSHPLNLNFFFHFFWHDFWENAIFCELFEIAPRNYGRTWGPWGPRAQTFTGESLPKICALVPKSRFPVQKS